jgi:hypothetical protein
MGCIISWLSYMDKAGWWGAFEAEEGAAINPKAFPLKLA